MGISIMGNCMTNVKLAVKEMCKPTERAFKGYTILFSLYSVATFLCLLIVEQLTEAHLRSPTAADYEGKDFNPDQIKSNVDTLKSATLGVGFTFLALAVLNF